MKTSLVTITLLVLAVFSVNANAACISPSDAESAVAGRTYVLQVNLDPENPVYLTFDSSKERTASYGSALDGHPGGAYHYRGNCHGHILVTFRSGLQPGTAPVEVLHLRPMDAEYIHMRSVDDYGTYFKMVVPSDRNSANQFNSGTSAAKNLRYSWQQFSDAPTKWVCWDDKAGIVVANGHCPKAKPLP